MDLEPFFSAEADVQLVALRTCSTCPVRMECLMQALSVEEEHGVWGGMLEADRRALMRDRRRTRQAAAQALAAAPSLGEPLVVGAPRRTAESSQAATFAA